MKRKGEGGWELERGRAAGALGGQWSAWEGEVLCEGRGWGRRGRGRDIRQL